MHWHEWVVLIAGSTGSALRAVRPPNLHITPDVRRDLVRPLTRPGSGNTELGVALVSCRASRRAKDYRSKYRSVFDA
jgi:hypothetical protein